jgi:hypothetical protein
MERWKLSSKLDKDRQIPMSPHRYSCARDAYLQDS